MTVKEYLSKIGIDEHSSKHICFVIGKVIKESSQHFADYYRNTPMLCAYEWFQDYKDHPSKSVLNFNVINTKQQVVSWLSGADWNPAIERGECISLLIMSDEELSKYYCESQWKETLKYIDKKIEEQLSK